MLPILQRAPDGLERKLAQSLQLRIGHGGSAGRLEDVHDRRPRVARRAVDLNGLGGGRRSLPRMDASCGSPENQRQPR